VTPSYSGRISLSIQCGEWHYSCTHIPWSSLKTEVFRSSTKTRDVTSVKTVIAVHTNHGKKITSVEKVFKELFSVVWFLATRKGIFSSLQVLDWLWVPPSRPAFYSMSVGRSLPGVKQPDREPEFKSKWGCFTTPPSPWCDFMALLFVMFYCKIGRVFVTVNFNIAWIQWKLIAFFETVTLLY